MWFVMKEEQILEMCHYSVWKLSIPSTLRNVEGQYIQNNIATFIYWCKVVANLERT